MELVTTHRGVNAGLDVVNRRSVSYTYKTAQHNQIARLGVGRVFHSNLNFDYTSILYITTPGPCYLSSPARIKVILDKCQSLIHASNMPDSTDVLSKLARDAGAFAPPREGSVGLGLS